MTRSEANNALNDLFLSGKISKAKHSQLNQIILDYIDSKITGSTGGGTPSTTKAVTPTGSFNSQNRIYTVNTGYATSRLLISTLGGSFVQATSNTVQYGDGQYAEGYYQWKISAAGTETESAILRSPFVSAKTTTPTTPGAPTISSISPQRGQPGTDVTISGSNLGAGTTFQFNGVVANILAQNNTEAVVDVPAAPGATGKITATNANGTATSQIDFIVTSSDPFDVLNAEFGEVRDIAYRGFIEPDNTYAQSSPTGFVVNGTAAFTPQLVFSQNVNVTVPNFAAQIKVIKSFGAGVENRVRIQYMLDNGEYIGCEFNGNTGQFPLVLRGRGVDNVINNRPGQTGIPELPEFDIGFGLADRSFTGWLVSQKVYGNTDNHIWDTALLDGNPIDDFRRPEILAKIVRVEVWVFSAGNAGSTFELGPLRWGTMQGVGTANYAAVTASDGSYYQQGDTILLGGSVAYASAVPSNDQNGVRTAGGNTLELDVETGFIRQRAKLWNRRMLTDGYERIIGDNSYSFVFDKNRNVWTCIASTWGTDSEGQGAVEPIYYEMATLPKGNTVLPPGRKMASGTNPLPRTNGGFANDTDHKYFDGKWHIVYTTNASGSFELNYATAASMAGPWTLVARYVAPPSIAPGTGTFIAEGSKLIRVNGQWYIISTLAPQKNPDGSPGAGIARYPVFNLALQIVGYFTRTSLSQTAASPAHNSYFVMQRNGVTQPYVAFFGDEKFNNGGYSWGNLHLYMATEQQAGYEFAENGIPA